MRSRPRVVFLCVHNAGRSQMAAAWACQLGGSRVEVFSGGSNPAARVYPAAVAVMAEARLDPAAVRPIRDEIRRRVEDLLRRLGAESV